MAAPLDTTYAPSCSGFRGAFKHARDRVLWMLGVAQDPQGKPTCATRRTHRECVVMTPAVTISTRTLLRHRGAPVKPRHSLTLVVLRTPTTSPSTSTLRKIFS